jgi:transcriptional regulator with XRE-family HTH domain
MRPCKRNFFDMDPEISDHLSKDVANDERAILDSLAQLREQESASLEAVAFMLGNSPGRLSGYLKGTTTTSLTNYLRIARALGYRSKIIFERAESDPTSEPLGSLKLPAHRVYSVRQ